MANKNDLTLILEYFSGILRISSDFTENIFSNNRWGYIFNKMLFWEHMKVIFDIFYKINPN